MFIVFFKYHVVFLGEVEAKVDALTVLDLNPPIVMGASATSSASATAAASPSSGRHLIFLIGESQQTISFVSGL